MAGHNCVNIIIHEVYSIVEQLLDSSHRLAANLKLIGTIREGESEIVS